MVAGTYLSLPSSAHTGMSVSPDASNAPIVVSWLVSARITRVSAGRQPDSRRSESCGRLSVRCSGPRLSWLTATTGHSISLASSFSPRDSSATSCCRLSTRFGDVISCR